jgi:PAP2 superfamily
MRQSVNSVHEHTSSCQTTRYRSLARRWLPLCLGVVWVTACNDSTTESQADRFDATDDALLLWRGSSKPQDLRATVFAWNEISSQFHHRPVWPGQPPARDARGYAMANAAMHDALNAIDRRYAPYAYTGTVSAPVSGEAAVAAAVHGVLVSLGDEITNKSPLAFAQAKYDEFISAIPDGPQKAAGIALGQAVAAAVIAKRANDGSVGAPFTTITSSGAPGEYRPIQSDPIALTGGTAVKHWGTVRPFVMQSVSQFRSASPYRATSLAEAVRTSEYLSDYQETKSYGGNNANTLRNAEQTALAIYWVESSAQGWNRVVRNLLDRRPLTAWGSARLLAQTHLAIADAYISVFDSKYHWNFWRPVTAIRLGNLDPATPGDPSWNAATVPAQGPTPPVPEWPSAHAMAAAAAAEVIKAQMPGTTEFTMESSTLPGQPRTVASVDVATRENSLSRIYAGFHWRAATLEGERVGVLLGKFVAQNSLQPLNGR